MAELQTISRVHTLEILTNSRAIPGEVADRIDTMLDEDTSIVNVDRFSEVVAGLADPNRQNTPESLHAATFDQVLLLGSCSIEMAWLQAGDLNIPRPRRLHEHNQSTMNVYGQYLAPASTDPRDRILRPMFMLQDGGKSLCVAQTGSNRAQSVYNDRVARNVLDPISSDVLSRDEKTVIPLLMKDFIGKALRRHGEKGHELDDVVAEARQELEQLYAQCPDDYRDHFDYLLITSYLGDAGGHTQKAYYIDAATGEKRQDVTDTNRYNPDGSETMMTLDRLFSEAPTDIDTLRLHQPKHRAVIGRLFPGLPEFYE